MGAGRADSNPVEIPRDRARGEYASAAWAALAVLLALTAQFVTVQLNYGGNWTGLFCTGSRFPIPPWLAGERIFVFAGKDGYDGQFYHYIAHDPWLRRDTAAYIDGPRLRYRRILVPLLAWLFSGGAGAYVHAAYLAVILGFVFLGAYWTARWVSQQGRHPAWSLAFLAFPGVIVSLDRMTLDGPLSALAAGFVLYCSTAQRWKLYAVLAAAALVRETGLLLTAAAVAADLRRRRLFGAALLASSALPALVWYAYVHSRTAAYGPILLTAPLRGLLERLYVPHAYPFGGPMAVIVPALDWIAIGGAVVGLALAVWVAWRRRDAVGLAAAGYGLLLATLKVHFWLDPYSYSRVSSPLLVVVALADRRIPWKWRWLPVVLMLPRVGLELGWQAAGVVRGLLG